MNQTLYIVDDDRGVLKVLSKIVKEQQLGQLIGSADCGHDAVDDIKSLKPDIILLDFLLPDIDGLEVIKKISSVYKPNIIMISEVSSKEMIAKAYRLGIEFFINKPINVVEVVSVIKKIKVHLNMQKAFVKFEDAFSHLQQSSTDVTNKSDDYNRNTLKRIFSKLSILGENGCDDLINAVKWLNHNNNDTYRLSDLYAAIVDDANDKSQLYAVEQRIRRIITKAFNELTERGLEDYNDSTFDYYASLLFDFSEIRKQMNYSKNTSKQTGKINIRKFIEGLYLETH